MTPEAIITLVIAIIGAVLGIINTGFNIWSFVHKERPKLRVSSYIQNYPGVTIGYIGMQFCIKVSNDSDFKINILEVGLIGKESSRKKTPIFRLRIQDIASGLTHPIESHSVWQYTLSKEPKEISTWLGSKYSYVVLDTGRKVTGKNPDLVHQFEETKSNMKSENLIDIGWA